MKKCLFCLLFFLPNMVLAQNGHRHPFGNHLLLGIHNGYAEDFVGIRNDKFHSEYFIGARAGVSVASNLYGGIQYRFIRADNFGTPGQNFYMAGIWLRGYLLHPLDKKNRYRMGAFLESGFLLGNYAFENRNSVQYPFEQPNSWYLPFQMGAEYRLFPFLTLELALNLFYNNGKSWDEHGIAYLSIGANFHL